MKDVGLFIGLGNFGTRYSSLRILSEYPVDSVTLDRFLVAKLGHDTTSEIIAGAARLRPLAGQPPRPPISAADINAYLAAITTKRPEQSTAAPRSGQRV